MPNVNVGAPPTSQELSDAYKEYAQKIVQDKQAITDKGGVLYNGSARDTNAAITRAQWDDYVKRFQPLETELQGELTFDPTTGQQNTQMIGANIARSQQAVETAFDASVGAQSRDLSRLGISPTGEQQSSIQRATAISRAAASVGAENVTRQRLAARNQEIAVGTVSPSGRNY